MCVIGQQALGSIGPFPRGLEEMGAMSADLGYMYAVCSVGEVLVVEVVVVVEVKDAVEVVEGAGGVEVGGAVGAVGAVEVVKAVGT